MSAFLLNKNSVATRYLLKYTKKETFFHPLTGAEKNIDNNNSDNKSF